MDFNWLKTVIMGSGDPMHPSIAHTVFVLAAVIASGIALSRIKIKGISLGMTWILFTGIAFGHFLDSGTIHHDTLHFIKEFGLILFVFFIGLQVGPGFFSSLKSGGLKLIGLASLVIFLGVGTAYAIHLITGEPLPTMVGVLSGAVTNTPGLGAAQQAYADSGMANPTIADSISLGYAVAYPLGVVGIIATMIIMRYVMRVDFKKEDEGLAAMSNETNLPQRYSVEFTNEMLAGKTIAIAHMLINRQFVVSRLMHPSGEIVMADGNSVLSIGDRLHLLSHLFLCVGSPFSFKILFSPSALTIFHSFPQFLITPTIPCFLPQLFIIQLDTEFGNCVLNCVFLLPMSFLKSENIFY